MRCIKYMNVCVSCFCSRYNLRSLCVGIKLGVSCCYIIKPTSIPILSAKSSCFTLFVSFRIIDFAANTAFAFSRRPYSTKDDIVDVYNCIDLFEFFLRKATNINHVTNKSTGSPCGTVNTRPSPSLTKLVLRPGLLGLGMLLMGLCACASGSPSAGSPASLSST